jgi:hypothetical protein
MIDKQIAKAINEGENAYRQTVLGQSPLPGFPRIVLCGRCGNKTPGQREGDTEYCTTCGGILGPAFTP